MNTRMTKAYLEKMGEAVNKQIASQNNTENKINNMTDEFIHHGFLPVVQVNHRNDLPTEDQFVLQTSAQKKFYGELSHKEEINDPTNALLGDVRYRDVPAKEGTYQLYTKIGLFSEKHHSPGVIEERKEFLFHEYMKSEEEEYRELANLQSRL